MGNYYLYTVAAEYTAFSIITTTKYEENTLSDILWENAPFRCNVCDMETLSYEEVMSECDTYDNTSFYVSDTSKGWDKVKEVCAS